MSAAANWSYTARATLWPRTGRDGWRGRAAFGAPVAIACDYKSEARRMVDSTGIEFVTRHLIYTEHAAAKRGDYVLIGDSTDADPTVVDGAEEVKAVTRYGDTFDRQFDDYVIAT
jgi:glutaredoxin